ncbi:hypothetical protein BU16DRAFT_83801 [Lophium mytilinum]|uniref:Uncharacterized protein n=1 Tax=Lophium mytilinum TaxID=390894 RepID=A0A6A6QN63_9PEZI|nr:hypothetical protein BU16DRAFT_83801 [Lophium mytilinum]
MATYHAYTPVHMQAFHRVSSPITPVHSPHQSLSSTPSRTPVHTLTLHEYRKQQSTPSPHTASPARSLKRKAATSRLGSLERVPLVQSSPSLSSTSLVTRSPPGHRHPQTLSSTFTRGQAISSASANHAQADSPASANYSQDSGVLSSASAYQGPDPSPSSTHHAYRALPSYNPSTSEAGDADGSLTTQQHPQKVLYFKAIKRLPKPLPLPASYSSRTYPATYPSFPPNSAPSPPFDNSPPRLWAERSSENPTTSTGQLRFSAGQTTASTVSLSRFPYPPPSPYAFSAQQPLDSFSAPTHIKITTTAPATPPATPAILHYRGASFDLINPHNSLGLHDIVTPGGDVEPDDGDYFPDRQSDEYSRDHNTELTIRPNPHLEIKMAPPRRVYTDLKSAHLQIARPSPFPANGSPNVNAPLPPEPVTLRNPIRPDSPFFPDLAPRPLNIHKPTMASRSEKAFKRLSSTFSKRNSRTKKELLGVDLEAASRSRASRTSGVYARPLSRGNRSASAIPAVDIQGTEDTRGGVTSETALVYSQQAEDHVSVYSDENDTYQHSLWDGSNQDRRSLPHGYRTKAIDYSGEVNPDSYLYENDRSARTSARLSRGRVPSEFPSEQTEQTDTLGRIVDGYNYPVTSNETRLVSLEGSSLPSPLPRLSSSLAKLDFDLRTSQYSNMSDANGPAVGNMYSRRQTMFKSPGSPPGSPLPLGPPIKLGQPRPSFDNRTPSSEVLSTETSYGDTRHLLGMSRAFEVPNVPRIPDRFLSHSVPIVPFSKPEPSDTDARRYSTNPFIPGALEPSSSYSQELATTPPEALATADRIFEHTRNEAKKPSIPTLWKSDSLSGISFPQPEEPVERTSPGRNSLEDFVDEDNERDWITINERRDVHRDSGDSIADYSSRDPSYDEDRQVVVHPGVPSIPHEYKKTQLESGETVLLPVYGGTRLPTMNALPRNFSAPYRHPSPLDDHEHPFDSSPPTMNTGRARESYGPFALDDLNLSPTPKAGELSDDSDDSEVPRPPARMGKRRDDVGNGGVQYEFTEKEMLDAGPNDDIIYGSQALPSSSHYGDSRSFSSGRAEPATMSTLAQERDNSFAKLTILGPKGNLTGTPLGTGMREVGSSLADSSSPGAAFYSTPIRDHRTNILGSSPFSGMTSPRAYASSPYSPFPTPDRNSRNSSLARGASYSSNHVPVSPTESVYSTYENQPRFHVKPLNLGQDPNEIELQDISRNGSIGRGNYTPAHDGSKSKRSSVANQTGLRELRLASTPVRLASAPLQAVTVLPRLAPDTATISSNRSRMTRMSDLMHIRAFATSQQPLREYRQPVAPLAQEHSPHLLANPHLVTPVVIKRLNRVSWIYFAACCVVPLALFLYPYGFGDLLVTLHSKCFYQESGDVFRKAGYRQKAIAVWAGPVWTIAQILIIVFVTLACYKVI